MATSANWRATSETCAGRSVQNLLQDLQAHHSIGSLSVSHELAVLGRVCDHLTVLHQGRIIGQGPSQRFSARHHIRTRNACWPPQRDRVNTA